MKAAFLALAVAASSPSGGATLTQEASIALPDTAGRIDHMAVDTARHHLFVAELGNGTLDVVDLDRRQVVHRISGLKEPQGVAYEPKADLLAVAGGGDGALRFYSGKDYSFQGIVKLGEDADNVRIDPRNGHFVVGFGNGALATIDGPSAKLLGKITLPGHPESFRLSGSKVFINVPDAGQIAVADLDAGKITSTWTPPGLSSNFPMILDNSGHVAVVYRGQRRLVLFDAASGKQLASTETCGDSDDLFFDAARKLFYVSCGAGVVDTIQMEGTTLNREARLQTMTGARTSLFVPEMDRLFVAERAGMLGPDAAILVLKSSLPR